MKLPRTNRLMKMLWMRKNPTRMLMMLRRRMRFLRKLWRMRLRILPNR